MKANIRFLLLLACIFTIYGCTQKDMSSDVTDSPDVSWQAQYDLGMRYLSEGKYEEAIIAFTSAIEIDPKKADAYLELAKIYVAQANIKMAMQTLEQGIMIVDNSEILQEYLSELEHSSIEDMGDTELQLGHLPMLEGVSADLHIQDKHTGSIEIHGLNIAGVYTIDTTGMEPMQRLLQWWVTIKSEDRKIAVWTAMWAYEQETSYTQYISEMQSCLSYYCSDGIDYSVADAPVEITQDGIRWLIALPNSIENNAAPETDITFDLYRVDEIELTVYDITQGGLIMDGLVTYLLSH